jgi:hypothetical protein
MRLVLAWLSAIVVVGVGLVLVSVGVLVAARHVASPNALYTVLLVHVPWTLLLLAAAVVASLVHRDRTPVARHVAAVFGVPALLVVGGLARGVADGTPWGGVISAVEAIVGAAVGWLITHRRADRCDEASYFPA